MQLVRKKAPPSFRTQARAGASRNVPPHDPIPYPMGTGTPKDKAWCKKCKAWRYFRKIRPAAFANGVKGRLGNCVQCATLHQFHPPSKRGR